MPPPWYQIPPLDFFSENLVPGEHHDRRVLSYQLTPQRVVPSEQLLARAEDLRARARSSGMVYAAPSLPAGTAPAGTVVSPYPAPAPHQPGGGAPGYTLPPGGWQPPSGP